MFDSPEEGKREQIGENLKFIRENCKSKSKNFVFRCIFWFELFVFLRKVRVDHHELDSPYSKSFINELDDIQIAFRDGVEKRIPIFGVDAVPILFFKNVNLSDQPSPMIYASIN